MAINAFRCLFIWLALSVVGFAAENVSWMSDLDAAKAKATAEKKPLLIDFTGSTWCPPCKALHKKVLTSSEFAAFSKDVVLVVLDYPPLSGRTPEKIKADPKLAQLMEIKAKYEVPGFPTVIYFDASGRQVSKLVSYSNESPRSYLARLTGKTP